MILHCLSAAPSSAAFRDCLAVIAPEDALLLLGDGVYATIDSQYLLECGAEVHVLRADALAAGLHDIPGEMLWAEMDDFVALTERYPRQLAWY